MIKRKGPLLLGERVRVKGNSQTENPFFLAAGVIVEFPKKKVARVRFFKPQTVNFFGEEQTFREYNFGLSTLKRITT